MTTWPCTQLLICTIGAGECLNHAPTPKRTARCSAPVTALREEKRFPFRSYLMRQQRTLNRANCPNLVVVCAGLLNESSTVQTHIWKVGLNSLQKQS